jgi:putative transposase
VSLAGKRRAVNHLCDERSYAERHACRLVEQPRATQRYEARVDYEERRIRQRLHELAKKHPGSGYRRMTRLLRKEGMPSNKKRVQRLWREEGLRNPPRKRRKRARGHSAHSCATKKAEYKNHVWCWDFTMDETADGRRLKWFSVLDEFTRENLALEVERRMTAREVVAILTWLEARHGAPAAIRSDNVLTAERYKEVRAKISCASDFRRDCSLNPSGFHRQQEWHSTIATQGPLELHGLYCT